jgi:hypothetical protein
MRLFRTEPMISFVQIAQTLAMFTNEFLSTVAMACYSMVMGLAKSPKRNLIFGCIKP